MKTLVHNDRGGLGGLTFLMPLMASLKAAGDTVHVCDPKYGWLATETGVADGEQSDPNAAGYDRTLKPDMKRPDVISTLPPTRLALANAPAKTNLLVVMPFTQWGLWPLVNWQTVIRQLLNVDNFFNKVLVVVDSRWDYQTSVLAQKSVIVSKNQPLRTIAPLLASARGWIAAEGGIGHLCAALGVPGVMLRRTGFLPEWKPRQPWATSLEGVGTSYSGITPDMVVVAVKNAVSSVTSP